MLKPLPDLERRGQLNLSKQLIETAHDKIEELRIKSEQKELRHNLINGLNDLTNLLDIIGGVHWLEFEKKFMWGDNFQNWHVSDIRFYSKWRKNRTRILCELSNKRESYKERIDKVYQANQWGRLTGKDDFELCFINGYNKNALELLNYSPFLGVVVFFADGEWEVHPSLITLVEQFTRSWLFDQPFHFNEQLDNLVNEYLPVKIGKYYVKIIKTSEGIKPAFLKNNKGFYYDEGDKKFFKHYERFQTIKWQKLKKIGKGYLTKPLPLKSSNLTF